MYVVWAQRYMSNQPTEEVLVKVCLTKEKATEIKDSMNPNYILGSGYYKTEIRDEDGTVVFRHSNGELIKFFVKEVNIIEEESK